MERVRNQVGNGSRNEERMDGWDAWDAVPRDGPAVFVIDTGAFDQGVVRGRWLDVTAERAALQDELRELLGCEPEEGSWAIIDQIGLGQLMAPETMSVSSLSTVAEDLTADSRW